MGYVAHTPLYIFYHFLLFLMYSFIFINMQIRYMYIILLGLNVMSQLLFGNKVGSLEW